MVKETGTLPGRGLHTKQRMLAKKTCDLQTPKEVDNMQTIHVVEGRHYANQMVYKGYDSWAQGL